MDDITLLRAIMLLGKNKQFETGTTSKAITLLNAYNKARDAALLAQKDEELAQHLARINCETLDSDWGESQAARDNWLQQARAAIEAARKKGE